MSEPTQNPKGPADFEKVLTGASATVASFEDDRKSPLEKLQHFLHLYPTSIPFIVLFIGFVGFSLYIGPRFYSPLNLGLVIQQVTVIAILGVAQTLVILTAGIDLSVGAIMILAHVVMGKLAVEMGVPVPIAFAIGLLTGLVCGAFNGALITFLELPPFIATLGTWNIFAALNLWYSESTTIRPDDIEAQAPFLRMMGWPISFGGRDILTLGAILMLVVAIIIWYVLNRTAFGRHVLATGDDEEAARLAGIRTKRMLFATYTLTGFICAIAGWALIGRVGAVSPNSSQTANLDSITAVVIGGTSLFGGRGSIIGTLVGAVIVGLFSSGIKLAGLDVLWQVFAVGCLIIIAVAIDQWIRKVSA
jgi:fructose transport system permease protein